MAPTALYNLANPLVTSTQLLRYQQITSILDTTDKSENTNTSSELFRLSLLSQSAGILLRLPQEVIAKSLVLLQRYWILSNQYSTSHSNDEHNRKDVLTSKAIIYLTAKQSFYSLSPRSVINVYAYLLSDEGKNLWFATGFASSSTHPTTASKSLTYHVSEGTHEREKRDLFQHEHEVLITLGFETHVALPHALALTYLSALSISPPASQRLARRVWEHLNGGLISPQLIYLTHQPNALAVAAIYLAAREVEVKLVEENWWEVFDVDREDLGFLVLAFGSLDNFARAEKERCAAKDILA